MKLVCDQSELSQALSIVTRCVNNQNTLPVLGNVLIKAEGQNLFLSATNLEVSMHTSISANIEKEGTLTVPAKILSSYVSLLKSGQIKINVLSGNTLELKSVGSDTKMKGTSSDEFPRIPLLENTENFNFSAKNLKEGLSQVIFSVSTNISRPALTGILFKISGGNLKLVATDSYRLAEKTLKIDSDLERAFIVPAKTAHELLKALSVIELEFVEVRLGSGQILFKLGNMEITSRLIDNNFPPYEKILPEECKTIVEISNEDLSLGLKQVAVVVKESNKNVRIKIENGKMLITSEETQVGQGSVEIPCKTEGENPETSLNAQYLLDVLSNVNSDIVYFGLNDKLSPVRIQPVKGGDYQHIIMPLKV